jgi:hypothetical protein
VTKRSWTSPALIGDLEEALRAYPVLGTPT